MWKIDSDGNATTTGGDNVKFIKTVDGDYVNKDCICSFTVETKPGYSTTEFVFARLNNNTHAVLREFQIPGNARAWLDNLVIKLNAEEKHHVED